jgi:hypothetical protein
VEPARPERLSAHRATMASALATIAALAIVFLPVPWCPWAALAHVPCPGCGLTRATLAALHGDLHASLMFHPLALVITPTVLITLFRDLYGYAKRGVWGEGQAGGRVMTVFAGVLATAMIGLWIARFFGLFGGPVPVG